MGIAESREADAVVLAVEGRLDEKASADLETKVQERLTGGARRFIVDLAAAEHLSGAALRVLLMSGRKLAATGGRLVLCAPSPSVTAALEIAGFTRAFTICASRKEALAAPAEEDSGDAFEKAAKLLGLTRAGAGEGPRPVFGDPELAARAASLMGVRTAGMRPGEPSA